MEIKMPEKTERKYSVKPQDFIPYVGPLLYDDRNFKEALDEGKIRPEPFSRHLMVYWGLGALDLATGSACMYALAKGLEALIK